MGRGCCTCLYECFSQGTLNLLNLFDVLLGCLSYAYAIFVAASMDGDPAWLLYTLVAAGSAMILVAGCSYGALTSPRSCMCAFVPSMWLGLMLGLFEFSVATSCVARKNDIVDDETSDSDKAFLQTLVWVLYIGSVVELLRFCITKNYRSSRIDRNERSERLLETSQQTEWEAQDAKRDEIHQKYEDMREDYRNKYSANDAGAQGGRRQSRGRFAPKGDTSPWTSAADVGAEQQRHSAGAAQPAAPSSSAYTPIGAHGHAGSAGSRGSAGDAGSDIPSWVYPSNDRGAPPTNSGYHLEEV